MTNLIGADPEVLERVGTTLQKAGDELRRKRSTLGRSLDSTPWKGSNAERFRHDFHAVHARSLDKAADFLVSAREILIRNAREQQTASQANPDRSQSIWRLPPMSPGFGWFPIRNIGSRAIDIHIIERTKWIFRGAPPFVLRPLPVPIELPLLLAPIAIGNLIAGFGKLTQDTREKIEASNDQVYKPDALNSRNPSKPGESPDVESSVPDSRVATPVVEPPVGGRRLVEAAEYSMEKEQAIGKQCAVWVNGWIEKAGLPPINNVLANGNPFSKYERNGYRQISADFMPGDIIQRCDPGGSDDGWGSDPHTALIIDFDKKTGSITTIEGNVKHGTPPTTNGVVKRVYPSVAAFQKRAKEVRVYRAPS